MSQVTTPANQPVWQADNYNARGQATSYNLGSQYQVVREYDAWGFPKRIKTMKNGNPSEIENLYYTFDFKRGNLTQRGTLKYYRWDIFTYDALDRLNTETETISGNALATSYADNGNILTRSDVGTYDYSQTNAGPHAVTGITNASGTLLPEHRQSVSYTPFNKASHISQGTKDYFITYGPDRLRRRTSLHNDMQDALMTKYYAFGDFERVTDADGTRELHYIAGGDGLAAVYIKYDTGEDTLFHIMQDHLGSIVGAINSESGKVYRQSYDAWGRNRNPQNWTYEDIPEYFPLSRGYTGHEHLKWFGLINMNGRMYDAALCRFLSPDPFVQMPDYSQNFNRYSYALNNPLVYTDPSGEFVVWDSWLFGLFSGGWNEANKRAGNDIKIWGGLFTTDENKNFGGSLKELFSMFTWQLPQTIGGFGTAHTFNTFGLAGGVESVDYLYGSTVVKTRNDGAWGVTQGNYIVGSNQLEADANNPLFQHEYGHYIQSQSMGWAYYPQVGMPSILSKRQSTYDSKADHHFNPVEQDANSKAIQYFHKNVDDFIWDFNRNPIGYRGNAWTMDDYSSKEFQNLLKTLIITPNLLDYYLPLFPITGLLNIDYYNTHYVNYQMIYYGKRK